MIYDSSTCLGYTLLVWWSLSTKIPHLPSFCIEIVHGSIYSLGIKQGWTNPSWAGYTVIYRGKWIYKIYKCRIVNNLGISSTRFYSWTAKVSRQVGHYEVVWPFWVSEEWNNANLKHDPDPDIVADHSSSRGSMWHKGDPDWELQYPQYWWLYHHEIIKFGEATVFLCTIPRIGSGEHIPIKPNQFRTFFPCFPIDFPLNVPETNPLVHHGQFSHEYTSMIYYISTIAGKTPIFAV